MAGYTSKDSRLLMTQGGLSKLIKDLPKEVRLEVRPAVRNWARSISQGAKSRAPVAPLPIKRAKGEITPPGTLRDAIGYKLFDRGLAAMAGIFGRGRKIAWYAHFPEFGTKPHFTNKGSRRKSISSRLRSAGGGMHPGTPERPYLRPAAQSAGPAGAQGVLKAMRSAFDKLAMTGSNSSTLVRADEQIRKIEQHMQALKASEFNKPVFGEGQQE